MLPPLFVRPLTAEDCQQLHAGLQSRDAFTLRRCQILLASAQGNPPAQIAAALGCASQTVRNTLHAFEQQGPDCLTRGSSRPHWAHRLLDAPRAERLAYGTCCTRARAASAIPRVTGRCTWRPKSVISRGSASGC